VPAGPSLNDPLGPNQASFFDPVECRIERTFIGAQHIAGPVLSADMMPYPWRRGPRADFQHQLKIERTLERVGFAILRRLNTGTYGRRRGYEKVWCRSTEKYRKLRLDLQAHPFRFSSPQISRLALTNDSWSTWQKHARP